MKPLALILAFVSIIATAEAAKGGKGGKGGKMTEEDKQEQKEKEEKKKKNEENRKAVNEVLAVKDKNGDGALSKDEYLIGEADPVAAGKRFDQFNKNGSRDLEKSEIETSLGL
jgi:hypothetical protein